MPPISIATITLTQHAKASLAQRCSAFLCSILCSKCESIRFLKKALALGEQHAQYTLGLIELEHGSRTEGLRMLEDYCAKYPENDHARDMLDAARENRLTFYTTPPQY